MTGVQTCALPIYTKHSMFLTSIVIAKEFWNSLSDQDKIYMKQAAMHSAKLERQWTLEDAQKIADDVSEQRKIGIQSYKEFAPEEMNKLKEVTKPVYEKYRFVFSDGLVDKIKNS